MRGLAVLPNGTGRKVRVLVFTQGDGVRIAEEAGADFVGSDELIKKIEDGWVDFEVAIATPDVMPKVSKLGKVLGRRGLMPNPKSGTIAPAADLPRLIKDARKGRVEFKVDKTSNLHTAIGKVSFSEEQLAREPGHPGRGHCQGQARRRQGPVHQVPDRHDAPWAPASRSTSMPPRP